ncbi:MAG: RNase H-like domain-containing protein, partial [Candidatus Saccharimonadales bacterium]
LTSTPALRPIDYKSDLPVILAVDSSYIVVGWILSQIDKEGKRRPARYGSIAWNERESRYSQPKIELYGLFRALQKLRPYIVGVKDLIVEVDARYIKGMLNNPDLQPNAAMNRWIFAILLYSFKLVHVPGEKHGPDGLSRHPKADVDSDEDDPEEWVDHALDVLYTHSSFSASVGKNVGLEEDLLRVYNFLVTAQTPNDLDEQGKQKFLRNALRFFVQSGHLWRKGQNGIHRRVPNIEERLGIMDKCHTYVGHKGIYGTRHFLTVRFWWPSIFSEIAEFVRSCHECQIRANHKLDASLTVQHPVGLFRKMHLDAMLMPKVGGYRYILAARCDLSGWLEARKSTTSSAKVWQQFIWEDIFCRWGAVDIIVTDNGSDIVKAAKSLSKCYGVNHIRISPYNSRANGKAEGGHRELRSSIMKLCGDDTRHWSNVFQAAVWADRITTRRATGHSPFFLAHGTEPSLPLDLIESNFLAPIIKPLSSVELVAARARQLLHRDDDVQDAIEQLLKARYARKALYDIEHKSVINDKTFEHGDLVLVRNSKVEKELGGKAKAHWFGPMAVVRRTKGGSYILSELDGTISKLRFGATRLFPYFAHPGAKIHITTGSNNDTGEDSSDNDE